RKGPPTPDGEGTVAARSGLPRGRENGGGTDVWGPVEKLLGHRRLQPPEEQGGLTYQAAPPRRPVGMRQALERVDDGGRLDLEPAELARQRHTEQPRLLGRLDDLWSQRPAFVPETTRTASRFYDLVEHAGMLPGWSDPPTRAAPRALGPPAGTLRGVP